MEDRVYFGSRFWRDRAHNGEEGMSAGSWSRKFLIQTQEAERASNK